jgi:hypothetical protein
MNYIWIIILIIIILFYLKYKTNFTDEVSFLAITYENEINNKNTLNLLKMFENNNYKYKLLGSGDIWDGWYGRLNSYLSFIKTIPDKDTFILICDGRDVIVNQEYSIFIKKALDIWNNGKIIIGTEKPCCTLLNNPGYISNNINTTDLTPLKLKSIYKNNMEKRSTSNSKFDYLNFGMLFGKCKDFIYLFELMDIKPGQDDQSLVYKIYYDHPELFTPDFNQTLFSNASHRDNNEYKNAKDSELCFYEMKNGSIYNIKTNTIPSLIQTPGKNWDCYNKLLSFKR